MEERGSGDFCYWKKPWHRWMILGVGLLQLWALWQGLSEYREITSLGILSDSAREAYTAQMSFRCLISALLAVIFWGEFLVGLLVRSKKQARLGEGLLMLSIALALAVAGALLPFSQGGRLFWLLLLVLSLGGGLLSLRQYLIMQE